MNKLSVSESNFKANQLLMDCTFRGTEEILNLEGYQRIKMLVVLEF